MSSNQVKHLGSPSQGSDRQSSAIRTGCSIVSEQKLCEIAWARDTGIVQELMCIIIVTRLIGQSSIFDGEAGRSVDGAERVEVEEIKKSTLT